MTKTSEKEILNGLFVKHYSKETNKMIQNVAVSYSYRTGMKLNLSLKKTQEYYNDTKHILN